jgi:hypothetical protein|tara:strand:+ start:3662 stop:4474 length:813 start_codon:yes stop_codon:yes gene_type:complete
MLKKNTCFLIIIVGCFFLTAGSCDHTVLKGGIKASNNKVTVGETITLELNIPSEFDDVHRIRWEVAPESAGEIKYEEQPIQWGKSQYGKEDRKSVFTAKRPGTCEIAAFGFYKQTNPQFIDKVTVEIIPAGGSKEANKIWCKNLLNNVIVPLRDYQAIYDTDYTEVTITSREAWDKKRLPTQVVELQNEGYTCDPVPEEFDYSHQEGDMLAQPAVTKVQWNCELPYQDYRYIPAGENERKQAYEEKGYMCEREPCLNEKERESFVWLCVL